MTAAYFSTAFTMVEIDVQFRVSSQTAGMVSLINRAAATCGRLICRLARSHAVDAGSVATTLRVVGVNVGDIRICKHRRKGRNEGQVWKTDTNLALPSCPGCRAERGSSGNQAQTRS